MFPLLVFMFCFFIGSIALFFYGVKRRDDIYRSLSDEHAQLRVLLRAMESRLDNIEKMLALGNIPRDGNSGHIMAEFSVTQSENPVEAEPAGHDPLLHLSFEEPGHNMSGINSGLDLHMEPMENPGNKENKSF